MNCRTIHSQLRKDIPTARLWLVSWAVLYSVFVFLSLPSVSAAFLERGDGAASLWILLLGGCGGGSFGLVLGLAHELIAADHPTRMAAFHRTRPIKPGTLVLGKALYLGVVAITCMVLSLVMGMGIEDSRAYLHWLMVGGMLTLAALGLFARLSGLFGSIGGIILLFSGMALTGVPVERLLFFFEGTPRAPADHSFSDLAGLILAVLGGTVTLYVQYRSRKSWLSGLVLLVTVIASAWTFSNGSGISPSPRTDPKTKSFEAELDVVGTQFLFSSRGGLTLPVKARIRVDNTPEGILAVPVYLETRLKGSGGISVHREAVFASAPGFLAKSLGLEPASNHLNSESQANLLVPTISELRGLDPENTRLEVEVWFRVMSVHFKRQFRRGERGSVVWPDGVFSLNRWPDHQDRNTRLEADFSAYLTSGKADDSYACLLVNPARLNWLPRHTSKIGKLKTLFDRSYRTASLEWRSHGLGQTGGSSPQISAIPEANWFTEAQLWFFTFEFVQYEVRRFEIPIFFPNPEKP